MQLVDLAAIYLYGLKHVVIFTAILLAVLGLEDLFIDLAYWARRVWRRLTVYRRHRRADSSSIMLDDQKPIVIMVPAWQEADVIGSMIDAACESIDYENYHIVIGTYPNDEATQRVVDELAGRHPHVQRVKCAHPGPSSKADCLNNIVAGVFQLEKSLGVTFAGFVLHDAEDVIPSLELRVFNYLLLTKDLIQLPVYPLARPLYKFTGGHYVDEFAEQHAKDIVVREALSGQVPSAGVGTCFSRRALLSLMRERDVVPFDVRSLTEDYDIAVRLARNGMKEVFVRFPAGAKGVDEELRATVVAVREFFPEHFGAAIRQKARWITGIVFQGLTSLRWGDSFWANYFLWRDRRGLIAHPVSFLATFLLLNVLVLWIYERASDNPWRFLGVFTGDRLLVTLLWINGILLLNRLAHRVYFVSTQYGFLQGLMSVPRALWSNVINFFATCRAALIFFRSSNRKSLGWDKTEHQFPEHARAGEPVALGQLAVASGLLTEPQLDKALTGRKPLEKLGQTLLRLEMITADQLAALLARQAGIDSEAFDPLTIDDEQRQLLPARLCRKYGVFPVRRDKDGVLVLACESPLLAMQVRALERRLKNPVRCVIVPQGSVAVALRLYCSEQPGENPVELLEMALSDGSLNRAEALELWRKFLHQQIMLGDILRGTHLIPAGALHQALFGYEQSDLPLGRFLVENGYLSDEALEQALQLQREYQPSMRQLLENARARGSGESGESS